MLKRLHSRARARRTRSPLPRFSHAAERLEPRTLLAFAPVAAEFRLNTTTAATQSDVALAADDAGNFVAAWASADGVLGEDDVRAQRFSAAGAALGAEFRVNATTYGQQSLPAVAADADGDFVVVWQSSDQDAGLLGGFGIYARRYNAAGVAQGGEFLVNNVTAGDQANPSVAMEANGDFVVAWQSGGSNGQEIYARRFNSAGGALGLQFAVNQLSAGDQSSPAVSSDADGDFVIAWHSMVPTAPGVYARRYNSAGAVQGAEFLVGPINPPAPGAAEGPSVASDADGDFVIAWAGPDHNGSGVLARRYNAAGAAQGAAFTVNTTTALDQVEPAVAAGDDGSFVVVWQGQVNNSGSFGNAIFARRYGAAGAPEGGEVRVGNPAFATDSDPAVAAEPDGDFVAAWRRLSGGDDVYARQFDVVPDPTASVADVAVTEGDSGTVNATFTVTLSGPAPQGAEVGWATFEGFPNRNRAGAGVDYTAASGTVTFNGTETSKTFTVPVLGDVLDEVNEFFEVRLTPISGATLGDAVAEATILDNDAAPVLSIADVQVVEGESGHVLVPITVTLSAPSGRRVTVDYATGGGTATAWQDYVPVSGTFEFDPGEWTKTAVLSVLGDIGREPTETLEVVLSNVTGGAALPDDRAVYTIYADELTVDLADASYPENSRFRDGAVVSLSAELLAGEEVFVDWAASDGTATAADNDYGAPGGYSGTLHFTAGQRTKFLDLVNSDNKHEPDETFNITLTGVRGAKTGDGQAVVTIQNDDAVPTVSISRANGTGAVSEGTLGSHSTGARFLITLSHPSSSEVRVQYATSDGPAVPPNVMATTAAGPAADYAPESGTAVFAPNVTSQTVGVDVHSDNVYEWTERFTMTLSNPLNATIGTASQHVDISNVGSLPSVRFDSEDVLADEEDDLTFEIQTFGSREVPVSVGYEVVAGSDPFRRATPGVDFVAATGTLTLPLHDNDAFIVVQVTDDLAYERDEELIIRLTSVTDAQIAGQGYATGVIVNDDSRPTLTVSNVTVAENAGPATFTVTLSNPAQGEVEVSFNTSDGTATAGADYTQTQGELRIAPFQTSGQILVPVTNDALVEGDETFNLTLSSAKVENETLQVNGDSDPVSVTGTITNDDTAPTVSVQDATVVEGGVISFTLSLSFASPQPVTVPYATADGTARSDAPGVVGWDDYAPAPAGATVTIPANQTTWPLTIQTRQDAAGEPAETFTVVLSGSATAAVADGTATGTILDDGDPWRTVLPLGSDVRVNTYTPGSQTRGRVASSPDGGRVVVWDDLSSDHPGVYGQRYDAAGLPQGGEFQVHTPAAVGWNPAVAMDADGDFVVVWESAGRIVGRQFDAAGVPKAAEFIVYDAGTNLDALVATDANGHFVVTWRNATVGTLFARYYLASGAPLGSQFPYGSISSYPRGVARDADGDTVFTWDNGGDVFARRYDAAGAAQGGAFAVASGAGVERSSSVGMDAAGNFVVAWLADAAAGKMDIRARRYDAGGSPLGDAFRITTLPWAGGLPRTELAVGAAGDFVVAWADSPGPSTPGWEIFAQAFDAAGSPRGDAVQASSPANPGGPYDPDVAVEADGDFTVVWSSGFTGNYDVYARQVDATPPAVSVDNERIVEGDGPGGAVMSFTVTLSEASTQTVTAQWATAPHAAGANPATAGADYTAASGTVTFLPGQRTRTFTVTVLRDNLEEGDETFLVNLSNPTGGAAIADGSGVGTIVDDDPKIGFFGTEWNVDRFEGNGGSASTPFDFVVRLSAPSARTITVDFTTANGNARDDAGSHGPADFRTLAGRLTFLPGETQKTITVMVHGDDLFEGAGGETFYVDLSNAAGATLLTTGQRASGVIRNVLIDGATWTYDDPPPVASVSDAVGLEGGGFIEFVVTLDRPSDGVATSQYELIAGTASLGSDFTYPALNAGTLQFDPFSTRTTVRVPLVNDLALEPDEAFTFRLIDTRPQPRQPYPTHTQVPIGDAEGVGTIQDNDGQRGPAVSAVFVNGTAWAPSFRNALARSRADAPLGYAVPAGSGQLGVLPWEGINQISVRFDMDVRVAQDDLSLAGTGSTAYPFSGFRYDAPTRTATWTLSRPLAAHRLALVLDGTAAGVVGADTGNLLDGQWANGADAFPSGDGTAGGDFRFGLNVLPGDVNRNGFVSSTDFGDVRARSLLRRSAARPGIGPTAYTPFHDVNGDGVLTNADVVAVYGRVGQSLPPAPPPAPALAPPRATEELFSAARVLA